MSDKTRAKKLAAAKRKLKEYHQQRGKQQGVSEAFENDGLSSGCRVEPVSESEKSEENERESISRSSAEKFDNNVGPDTGKMHSDAANAFSEINGADSNIHLDAIEVLIGEKASLSTQVTKLQNSCKEKDLEIEELNTMLESAKRRIDSLEKITSEQSSEMCSMRSSLEEARGKLSAQESDANKLKREYETHLDYIEELKHELALGRMKTEELEAELKEKICQLELYKIRINQISEEASVATDNRVEDLIQVKFAHEQQIKDLEATVKQLNSEKEQGNQQYQNYVQHLSKEVSTLSEKNLELMNEKSKLMDREKTMIDHIARLERQIQENIARQELVKANESEREHTELAKENSALKEQNEGLTKQIAEMNLTAKSLESKIEELTNQITEMESKIYGLEKENEKLCLERPDSVKLLAAIESDKVAASRAVAQNEELKKQLEEIQFKLIQVTNEKVELVDLLHSERHANKEVRANFEQMSETLKQTSEKLHFKDEEMIRLIHENNELNKKILQLNQQVDRLMHYEANEYVQKYIDREESNNNNNRSIASHGHEECAHFHDHECGENNDVDNCFTENATEAIKVEGLRPEYAKSLSNESNFHSEVTTDLPAAEAMQKLQDRFKTLIGEVADLTDEKQRLEHLVLQLQGETETIGEYIALYQTQRRVLKQREIEKNTQLHRLLTEREEMKEKIVELTQLISNLEVKTENPKKDVIQEKIHNIISEIKEKDNIDGRPVGCVDHCACCSGKFETI